MENSKHTALSSSTKPNSDLIAFITKNISKDKTILDWGSGHGRHTNALRNEGYKVWSYDPYNGKETLDGYNNISKYLPDFKHDVIFTAYVLNVIPKKEFYTNIILIENVLERNGTIIHKVREDSDLLKKHKENNGNHFSGKKGSIQRYVCEEEFTSIKYYRDYKHKLYYADFESRF